MRFNYERAERFAQYSIYSLLDRARAEDIYVISIPRPIMAQALHTTRLMDDHLEFIADKLSTYSIAMTKIAGVFYFFKVDEVDVKDASSIIESITDMYADLSKDAADRKYDADDYWEDLSKKTKKKASGKKKA